MPDAPFIGPAQLVIDDTAATLGASGIIRSYCGWHIWPSKTETGLLLDSSGGDLLFLPTKLLTAVASVATVTADGTETPLTAGTDYTWSATGVLQRVNGCWPAGQKAVKVSITHGYATVPDEITAVAVSIAKRYPGSAQAWTSRSMGSTSLSVSSASAVGGLNMLEAMILSRYALHGVA